MEAVDGDENSDVRIRLGVFAGEIRIVMLLAVGVESFLECCELNVKMVERSLQV